MYIFEFLLDFASVVMNWASTLWQVLNMDITIFDINAPLWTILGVGGLGAIFIANIIKNIID